MIVVGKDEEERSVVIIHYKDHKSDQGQEIFREDKLEDVANGDKCVVDNSLDCLFMPVSPIDVVQRARSRVSVPPL